MTEKQKNSLVVFETNLGNFTAEIYEDKAPKTSDNFLSLVKKNFYDGVIFHRVIPDFVIQGGDPTGTGMGGPGYKIKDEFGEGLIHDEPGILSMANAGSNTGGSQFFITLAATPWLDKRHAIFGKIVEGYHIIEEISSEPTDFSDRPLDDIVMTKVYIKE